jgi:hypothetical protein
LTIETAATRADYRSINAVVRYEMFSVFQVRPCVLGADRCAVEALQGTYDALRRRMLADHGKLARDYPDVRANTMAAFALGDYEWILAFEAPQLHRIVDLMRKLRAAEARRHVRAEIPFFTGPRVAVDQLIATLP